MSKITKLENELAAFEWAHEEQCQLYDDLVALAEVNVYYFYLAKEQADYLYWMEREIETIKAEIQMEEDLRQASSVISWMEQALDALEAPRYIMSLA